MTEVVLALGFRPEPFMEAFPDGRCGDVTLTYAVEPEPLDTGGAIKFAAEYAGIDETFVVANGDVLTDLDVGDLIAAHQRFRAQATLHLIGVDEPSAFGVVDLDETGRVRAFVEKPAPGTEPSNLINAGTYVFEPSVLDSIPSGVPTSIERDTFQRLVATDGLYGYPTADYWIDAGRPDLYRAANLDMLAADRRFDHCEAISDSAVVADDAAINNSVIGERVTVGVGATVTDSVLLPGAVVKDDAMIERSLIMGSVGASACVVDSMLGSDGIVGDGERLHSTARPSPM